MTNNQYNAKPAPSSAALLLPHFRNLRESGLLDKTIDEMGVRSISQIEIENWFPVLKGAASLLEFPYPGVQGYSRCKVFWPEGHQGKKFRYYQPTDSGTHLYMLPMVKAAAPNPGIKIAITEGEKKAACLYQHNVLAVGIGGVWSWVKSETSELHPEFSEFAFVDRPIEIIFDSDTWVKEQVQQALYALGKTLEAKGARVEVVVILPGENNSKQGADDFIAKNGFDKFKELKRIPLKHPTLHQHKEWFEKWKEGKEDEAKEVDKVRVKLNVVDPWPDIVDGAALLDDMVAVFSRYLVLPQYGAEKLALWCLHAHTYDCFGISPILEIRSPEAECGKTKTQHIISRLTQNSIQASNITKASLERIVDKLHPTLIIDEADTFLSISPELRGIINAGHSRESSFVIKCDGDDNVPTQYSTWCPKSIAIIGDLPATLRSRSITISMRRKTPLEKVERYRSHKPPPELDIFNRKAVRWAVDNAETLKGHEPTVPAQLENRSLDNWEPLLSIAQVVGGQWPDKCVRAILGLEQEEDQSIGVQLLADLKTIFDDNDKVSTAALLLALSDMEDRPWPEFSKGKPMTPTGLAHVLKPFGIRSQQIRFGDKTFKGYYRNDFKDAWARYVGSEPKHTKQDNESHGLDSFSWPEHDDNVSPQKSGVSAEKQQDVSNVSAENVKDPQLEGFEEVGIDVD